MVRLSFIGKSVRSLKLKEMRAYGLLEFYWQKCEKFKAVRDAASV
jgi:hypothetical protein